MSAEAGVVNISKKTMHPITPMVRFIHVTDKNVVNKIFSQRVIINILSERRVFFQ